MSYSYAHLDKNNFVVGMSNSPEEINAPHLVEIPHYDETLIGSLCKNGVFEPHVFCIILDDNDIIIDTKMISKESQGRSINEKSVVVEKPIAHVLGLKYVNGMYCSPDVLPSLQEVEQNIENQGDHLLSMEDRIVERITNKLDAILKEAYIGAK